MVTKKDKDILHVVELKDQHRNVFYDKLKFIYLELPKFKREEEELETQFDKWLYAFTHLSELQERPKKLEEPVFTRLFDVAEVEKFDIEERLEYEGSLKVYRDLYSIADTAEQKGMKKGMEKGRKEGKEEGIKEGIEKGRKEGERQKAIKIAKELKNSNIPIKVIIQSTGLSEQEIINL